MTKDSDSNTEVQWISCSSIPGVGTSIVEFRLRDERLQGDTELLVHVPTGNKEIESSEVVRQAAILLRSVLLEAAEKISPVPQKLH